jgi:hypothetical protein
MSKIVHSSIQALFVSQKNAGEEKSSPLDFEWRLVRRRGRPFMLLPSSPALVRTGLNLYSAQRRRAKVWRKVLPLLFHTPLAGLFEHVRFRADASAEIIQFMSQQAGVPAEQVFPAAIKLSEAGSQSRLVLLLCDESGRPARVIKAGLNAAGRAATDKEADFLAQLPPGKLGCVRLVGRLSTPTLSAFSTDYFPGTSPFDDAGLENLFHDWLNPDTTAWLELLPAWQELAAAVDAPHREAWRQISAALAGKTVRTTLYHGDFTPWNVRTINSRNLQVFDWERGSFQGIPGWDWFHFTIQTAILARRHSAERAAAEVEQLIHSPRFKKYAVAAGISEIVEPLVLAYLLHHVWVTKPSEGGRSSRALFDLLSTHWLKHPSAAPAVAPVAPAAFPAPGLWAAARHQLNAAAREWANLFWEPSLNYNLQPSWRAEFQAHWPAVLISGLLLSAIATAQYHSLAHLVFLPFYITACAFMTWKAGRRWGALAAAIAAVLGPLVVGWKDAGYLEPSVMLWNTVMRFVILDMCVFFVDRIHKQGEIVHHRLPPARPPVKLAENWAVLLACGLFFFIVAWLNYVTDPHMVFLPLYLVPCMMLTLVLNVRWGLAAVLLTTTTGTWIDYCTNKVSAQTVAEVFTWNLVMRVVVSLTFLVLLDRIRKDNILFSHRKTQVS